MDDLIRTIIAEIDGVVSGLASVAGRSDVRAEAALAKQMTLLLEAKAALIEALAIARPS